MYCRYCGKPIPDDSQYCEFCGKQINDSLNEESSATSKKEVIDRCRICKKIFNDNEPRISLETGGVMCKDCAAAFGEEFIDEEWNTIDAYEAEIDDEISGDSDFGATINEKGINAEIGFETNFDRQNQIVISPQQFDYIDTDDLKEYLDIVVDMEKNIYLQNSLISQMKERYAHLGQAHLYEEPTAPKDSTGGEFFEVIESGVSALIGFLLIRWGLQLCNAGLGDILLGLPVLVFGGAFLIVGVIAPIAIFVQYVKQKEAYLVAKEAYDIAYAEYEKNVRIDKKRVSKEKVEKKVLSLEIQLLQKQNKDSKRNLEQIYSLNIIFPKYRNLTMLCSIYEYIRAGRCTTLEGHEGAYNILEMEIRLDRIITQLNLVIARLDSIRNNQYMLYSVIQESNQQTAQILESTNYVMDSLQNFHGQAEELTAKINSVENNSVLAAYQAESIKKELHYMNRMSFLSGKYNNVFYNVPPS